MRGVVDLLDEATTLGFDGHHPLSDIGVIGSTSPNGYAQSCGLWIDKQQALELVQLHARVKSARQNRTKISSK